MISKDDRVSFTAREYGPGDPIEGTPVTLTGTVTREIWGLGRNVSIMSDDGRTFVRLEQSVTKL